jgi:Zonula occludens toxin
MIYFYSGTPGSGKSLHVAMDIYNRLRIGKRDVIATFPIALNNVSKNGKKKIGKFTYVDVSKLTVEYLLQYAQDNHVSGKEAQTLVVIDECQIIFNPREFNKPDRLKWITFFTQHRKLGYNFILISQFDRLIDRQIRCLFEYEVKHRKANNFSWGKYFPFTIFVAVTMWYGVREKVNAEFFMYRKKYGALYDTFTYFADSIKDLDKSSTVAQVSVGENGGKGVPISPAVAWKTVDI